MNKEQLKKDRQDKKNICLAVTEHLSRRDCHLKNHADLIKSLTVPFCWNNIIFNKVREMYTFRMGSEDMSIVFSTKLDNNSIVEVMRTMTNSGIKIFEKIENRYNLVQKGCYTQSGRLELKNPNTHMSVSIRGEDLIYNRQGTKTTVRSIKELEAVDDSIINRDSLDPACVAFFCEEMDKMESRWRTEVRDNSILSIYDIINPCFNGDMRQLVDYSHQLDALEMNKMMFRDIIYTRLDDSTYEFVKNGKTVIVSTLNNHVSVTFEFKRR